MIQATKSIALLLVGLQLVCSATTQRALAQDTKPDTNPDAKTQALKAKLHRTLDFYFDRKLDTGQSGPWAIMHGIIAYGVDTTLHRDSQSGPEVNAIGWLCFNRNSSGQRLLYTDGSGRIGAHNGPGLQGHGGQFLAILAQSRLKVDYPMRAGGKKFTIKDLIEHEKRTCQSGTELTFKLIGLTHYLKSDEEWKNEFGEKWTIQRLIKEELAQSVRSSACGGTHRMMGFSYAVRKRRVRGEKMVGQWRRAEKFVNDYHKYTFGLQNDDGSFSTNWFNGRGDSGGLDRRLETTGHILEWMIYSLPEKQLTDPRIVKAVNYLTGVLHDNPRRHWEVGPLGHAVHGLVLYDQRVFKSWRPKSKKQSSIASSVKTAARDSRTLTGATDSVSELPENDNQAADEKAGPEQFVLPTDPAGELDLDQVDTPVDQATDEDDPIEAAQDTDVSGPALR